MFKKLTLIIVAVLILAIVVLVVKERISPPGDVLAKSTTLTVLHGDNVFLSEEEGSWENVTDTVVVKEGNGIKTGDDSWALITFEDGTTVELEPNTEVSVTELTNTQITVWQQVGRTWSGIKKLVGPLTQVQVETPSAAALVRGTLIDVVVDSLGNTIVSALEGVIEVTAEGISRTVEAGMQSLINMGLAPSEPEPIPPPKNRLEITVRGPAWALIVDPPERSVGVVPPGVVASQLPMATTTGAHAEPQFVVVPVPEEVGDRTYSIVLYGKDPGGNVDVEVKGFVEGQNVLNQAKLKVPVEPYEEHDGVETKYVALLTVTVNAEGDITDGELGDFLLKETPGPGKVDIKDWAIDRSDDPVAPQANFSLSVETGAVCFTSLSTGDIDTYSWDFGDGNTSQEMSPEPHKYTEAGVYVASLNVSGPGGEDAVSKEICVVLVE